VALEATRVPSDLTHRRPQLADWMVRKSALPSMQATVIPTPTLTGHAKEPH